MVCGSIGYGGVEDIKRTYSMLRKEGFQMLDHISKKRMDYSSVKDFRNRRALARKIVEYDMRYVKKADLLVVISNGPSYGTGMEMYAAKGDGKKIVLFAEDAVPTPWPVNFSDYVVTSKAQLLDLLHKLESGAMPER